MITLLRITRRLAICQLFDLVLRRNLLLVVKLLSVEYGDDTIANCGDVDIKYKEGDKMSFIKNNDDLREFENSEVLSRYTNEKREKITKKGMVVERRPSRLIIIGIVSLLILIFAPNLLKNENINNMIKLLLSMTLLLSILGTLALPYGLFRLFKRRK